MFTSNSGLRFRVRATVAHFQQSFANNRNFTQWFDREIAQLAAEVAKLAKSLHEEVGYVALRFEKEGEDAIPSTSGGGIVNRAVELAGKMRTLDELKQLREHKRAFETVEADDEARLRTGCAATAALENPQDEPPPPAEKPARGKRSRRKT